MRRCHEACIWLPTAAALFSLYLKEMLACFPLFLATGKFVKYNHLRWLIQYGGLKMEKLYAYLLLYAIKLMPEAEFEHILDLAFLHSPDSKFLLDLEWDWPDRQKSLSLIKNYWAEHFHQFNETLFGKTLFQRIQPVYLYEQIDLSDFGEKMYQLWSILPSWLANKEPFSILCYARDPLSWDEPKLAKSAAFP